ncbi:alpha/beta hydrolase [Paenibacillus zeisoli]|uniref:Alpha/beta hydrolase n=1 Tax=Paenibacillus zeisoli TaxID=2496267 RepID=A0A433XHX5_9BACL|nr:alpha/beta hydrolase [Paenibacillus zeisoli]RUT33679.1 alpha/beta hydrolase [Paenibacillus zeisoli]
MHRNLQDKTGFVFIYGAGLESQIWSRVIEGLDCPCLPLEFPLRKGSFDSRSRLSLEDYMAHMKNQVDEWGVQRFVIVAHSIGGVLALRLASELTDRLVGMVAISAAIPKNGGSYLSVMPFPNRILMSALLHTMGTKPPESAIRTCLCNDLSSDQASEIARGFTPEAVRLYTDRINVSVPDVPKMYVKLTQDKAIRPSLQSKMISNFSPQSVRSLETGHLPMVSNPEGLRSILEDFLTDTEVLR